MINEKQRQHIMNELGYDPYNEKDILKRARKAKGNSIQELLDKSPIAVKKTKSGNKGKVQKKKNERPQLDIPIAIVKVRWCSLMHLIMHHVPSLPERKVPPLLGSSMSLKQKKV